jgi:CRISPR/Cas system-associated protein endoribonuclease Cas2
MDVGAVAKHASICSYFRKYRNKEGYIFFKLAVFSQHFAVPSAVD